MSAPPPESPSSTRRFERKREAILDGAARLFNQQGIRGGTLADVARSVGLATNSLSYYYAKKEDLASACMQRSMQVLSDCATTAAAQPGLRPRVRDFLVRYLALLAEIAQGRHPELIIFSDLLTLPEPHAATLHAGYTQMFRNVRRLLQGSDAPTVERDALNARAHLLLSLTAWTRAWLPRFEAGDYVEVAERVAAQLVDGLAAPGQILLEREVPAIGDRPADDRRGAYLRAASRLVNQQGYHGASVDRIATELGLTKGSFYHHHETKEELLGACFERTFDVMREAQLAARDTPGTGLERLALACRALLRFQMSDQGPLLRITAWTALPQAMRRDSQRTMARLGERFASFVIDGMADGSMRITDPSIAAQMVNGMLNAAAELGRWVAGADVDNAFALYARPLFEGLARR